ncbi:unnamed protein product [Meloidogyne enterolobii]|uniref:Uncharacterized protein n=1 Tax=Meloidogyne enterolobii TaxID=390850 RepID=A0ACB0XKA7_MELEN
MQICTKVPKYAKICYRNPVPNVRTDVKTPFLSVSAHGISACKICICMACQNMHGKSQNMRIYMHRKRPKYAQNFPKYARDMQQKNSKNVLQKLIF